MYGLKAPQMNRIGRLLSADSLHELPPPKEQPPEGYQAPIRVIAMNSRNYDSTTTERLPVFGYDRNRVVFTIEQTGTALAGYLGLTIDGKRYVAECRRENLNDLKLPGLRVTVFPGLWEFDFGQRERVPSITAERLTDDEETTICEFFDDETALFFGGGLIVRRENWVSIPADKSGTEFASELPVHYREVVDAIPYQTASVVKGAIGLAHWSWDAGYLVGSWQCRTFSHATGYGPYVQAADPVPITGNV